MVIAILVVMGAILVVMFATNVSPTGTDVRGDSYSGSYVCNQCFTDWNRCAS